MSGAKWKKDLKRLTSKKRIGALAGRIERVRVFVKVAELSGFAAAARELGVTRSIATRYVSELEEELGAQLLVRTTRKVSTTVAGQLYLDRMRPLLAELDRADELIRQQHDTLSGELRLSAPVSFGQKYLPPVLEAFRSTYPDVILKVHLSDRFVDVIKEGFDMSLRISGPPRDVSTIWRKIAFIRRFIVASPTYLESAPPLEAPEDLIHHAVIGYSHFSGGQNWQLTHSETSEKRSALVKHCFESNSGELIVDMTTEGGGLSMMPDFLVGEALATGTLRQVLSDWEPPEIWLTAYYPPYERLPAKVEAFTGFIEERVRAIPEMVGQAVA